MDSRWVDGPDEITTVDEVIRPWLPMSQFTQPVPPCARCGEAYAAHLEGRCPPAQYYKAPRRDWPTRHPWYTAAILLVALLGGVGVGAASVNHINYNTPNAHACYAYWEISDAAYAFNMPNVLDGWHQLVADEPTVTDPTLQNAVRAFNDELFNADLPDAQTTSATIEASCNSMGYTNPS